MNDRFKIVVCGHYLHDDGIPTYVAEGRALMVEGHPYVHQHGMLVRDCGYSATIGEARLRAAMEIEALGRRLLDQAERMRIAAQEVTHATP